MKKILLATSALVTFAGAAAADVTVSGTARMGVVYGYTQDTNGDEEFDALDGVEAAFSSRFRVIFTASGETDGGLTFGASVRNDQSGVGNQANGDSTVFISGAFGKITMGDTGNASDSILGQVSGVGYTGIGDYNEIGFISRDTTGAQYEYSAGAVTFAVGLGQGIDTDAPLDATDDDFVSAAVKYSADTFTIGVAYEENDTDSQVTAMGSATFGGATVKLKIVDRDSAADTAAALSVDYVTGALTVTAFATDNVDFGGTDTLGLGASYDLGGGAAMVGGVVDNGTDTLADLGLTFSF
jgi:outer membrane protein OmpU